MGRFQEYQVIGRKLPSEKEPEPKLYRMRIFAPNDVVAKSRFWYFLRKLRKVKKATGEVVAVNVVCPICTLSYFASSLLLTHRSFHLLSFRLVRRSHSRSRISVFGWDMILDQELTTCTRSSENFPELTPFMPATKIWLLDIVHDSDQFRYDNFLFSKKSKQ